MRPLHSPFHSRHARFAAHGPDGYVDALMAAAREASVAAAARRPRPGPREGQASPRR